MKICTTFLLLVVLCCINNALPLWGRGIQAPKFDMNSLFGMLSLWFCLSSYSLWFLTASGPSHLESCYAVIILVRGLLNSWFTWCSPDIKSSNEDEPDINELSFTELRDKLLALDPLNKDHVIKVNQAEAEFWKKSEGYRVGWSDEILGFDCGGQQWVSETCYPAGTLSKPSMKDIEFMEELKQLIEKEHIPAPAPIEQRWTARSKSPMSPASSPAEDDIFSWVFCCTPFTSLWLRVCLCWHSLVISIKHLMTRAQWW